jgi:hypothetical protein
MAASQNGRSTIWAGPTSRSPELGTTEIWRFINDSGTAYPMHMHLVAFQVLDRDGFTKGAGGEIIPNGNPQAPPAEETAEALALVAPNEILRVIARFGGPQVVRLPLSHPRARGQRDDASVSDGPVRGRRSIRRRPAMTARRSARRLQRGAGSRNSAAGRYVQWWSISMTVAGQVISVTTTAGMTAAQVAQAWRTRRERGAPGLGSPRPGSRVITDGDISGST